MCVKRTSVFYVCCQAPPDVTNREWRTWSIVRSDNIVLLYVIMPALSLSNSDLVSAVSFVDARGSRPQCNTPAQCVFISLWRLIKLLLMRLMYFKAASCRSLSCVSHTGSICCINAQLKSCLWVGIYRLSACMSVFIYWTPRSYTLSSCFRLWSEFIDVGSNLEKERLIYMLSTWAVTPVLSQKDTQLGTRLQSPPISW